MASAQSFNDVTFYKEEVSFLTSKEIINGYPDGSFKPNQTITRSQAIRMIIRDIDPVKKNVQDPGFTDVTTESTSYYEIARAVELGIISGKTADNGTKFFDTSGTLTRGQLAKILTNTYQLKLLGTTKNYKDVSKSNGYYSSIQILTSNRITTGYENGYFKVNEPVSRVHFAVFMARTLDDKFKPKIELEKPTSIADFTHVQNAANEVLVHSTFKASTTSVTIREAKTGQIIYKHYSKQSVKPASNQKLLTGAAALEILGENHRFKTSLWIDGTIKNGILHGNVYIKGHGDPTLLPTDLNHLATQLKQKGILQINGSIYGDSTWYDDVRHPDVIQPEDEPYYYAAQTMALTLSPNKDYDAGSVIVSASPTRIGAAPVISLEPKTSLMKITNHAKVGSSGTSNTLKISRRSGKNEVIITGTLPANAASKREWIAVVNPALYAVDIFKQSLVSSGVKFGTNQGGIGLAKVPTNATKIVEKQSAQLKSLLPVYMKLSNNMMAETFVKEMGKVETGTGSWKSGLNSMVSYGNQIGLTMSEWKMIDGSGLSYKNSVSSEQVSLLLYKVKDEPWYYIFENSLPVAGNSDRLIGGTLRYRLAGWPVRGMVLAKTGSLDNVKSLSGYTKTRDGDELIFSILTEDNPTNMIPHIDRLVLSISTSKR